MSKKDNYNNDSIKSLKGADRVRLRPAVIFGSDGIEGCKHSVFEILSNSIDEFKQGVGNVINIIKHKDKSITIEDFGRGIPVDFNESEGKYNWELVFCELYAGGKYNNNDGNDYNFSLGLNGLGLCSTQYASEFMNATIIRDGYKYYLEFKKGNNTLPLVKTKINKNQTSTKIHWKPDLEVFTDIDIPNEYFEEILKRQAIVNAGLTFNFYDEEKNTSQKFFYENGIKDYLNELSNEKSLSSIQYLKNKDVGRDREDKDNYRVEYEIAFCFNNEINLLEYYHNSSFLEYGGSPDKAVRNAFIYCIDNYLKTNNLYKKNEKKITFTDIEDSLIYISNSFSTVTSYENQTKKSITNKFIQESITNFLRTQLPIYFIENKADADRICNQVLINKRSRESAENTRINIKKKLTGTLDINNRVNKFVNCRSKDILKREIYIVEGDSALGACKLGRDAEFQAIIPVRGKILNCLKADYEKIFTSDIIIDLLRVLGCGVEINSKHNKDINTFDINNLQWNKIIICTDADVDGFQIRTLILTMLYRLVPTLIKENKVFIAESPLYEITHKKKTYFAYSDGEKNKILEKIDGKYTLQRSKGLGENEPDMMWKTTMNPKTRKLVAVTPCDIDETTKMFNTLLGDDLQSRKNFITNFGHNYIDLTDTV